VANVVCIFRARTSVIISKTYTEIYLRGMPQPGHRLLTATGEVLESWAGTKTLSFHRQYRVSI